MSQLNELIQRVMELQSEYSRSNTEAMHERGMIIRSLLPSRLREVLAEQPADSSSPSFVNTLSVEGRDGTGNKTKVPWTRVYDKDRSPTATKGLYLVYLFAMDGSSTYLSLIQGTTEFTGGDFRARDPAVLKARGQHFRDLLTNELPEMKLEAAIVVDPAPGSLGEGYAHGNILAVRYRRDEVPPEEQLLNDLLRMCGLLNRVYEHDKWLAPLGEGQTVSEPTGDPMPLPPTDRSLVQHLRASLAASGFIYEPWQVAAFVTAIRTKPFVILAGVSGTGKSKLPVLAAEATSAIHRIIPVRPDWTDSGDLLGYTDLADRFQPKEFLRLCLAAQERPNTQHFAVLDEMNIARVEHYFAEVLSRIEDRPSEAGSSNPLVPGGGKGFEAYQGVGLSRNLAIVGTVNMDESTHGFSRKVLDRAFTIELSDIDLAKILEHRPLADSVRFDSGAWVGAYRDLSAANSSSEDVSGRIERIVKQLVELNRILARAQMQLGYRSRDEIILFVLNAESEKKHFVDHGGKPIDPLDLALMMKVLPRVAGGSQTVQKILEDFVSMACQVGSAGVVLDEWRKEMPAVVGKGPWPRSAARACLMLHRLDEGYTSFYL